MVKLDAPLFQPGTSDGAVGLWDQWKLEQATVTIDELGDPGGVVRGSYAGVAYDTDGEAMELAGEFAVCSIVGEGPCP